MQPGAWGPNGAARHHYILQPDGPKQRPDAKIFLGAPGGPQPDGNPALQPDTWWPNARNPAPSATRRPPGLTWQWRFRRLIPLMGATGGTRTSPLLSAL